MRGAELSLLLRFFSHLILNQKNPSCYNTSMSFGAKYKKITEIIKDDLTRLEEELKSEINLYPQLNEVLSGFLTSESKRIRAVTAFLYLRASGYEPDEGQYNLQTAVEIIHSASLLHDDVIDECDIRRGKTALNKVFNNKIAILTGDYLLATALDRLNKLSTPEITALCAETVREMCRGEFFQYFNLGKIPTIEQYLKKTEQKTAGLFRVAIEGAMKLSGSLNTQDAADFALAFGTAFQIRDDLLNITESSRLKPSKNDLLCGIYNAPVIFSGSTSNLAEGIEKTKNLLNNYVIKMLCLTDKLKDSQYKTALRELLELLNDV